MSGFVLDHRLRRDTHAVGDLPLCTVRLMNDSRFPWLVLVPRRVGIVEVDDLDADDQATLWQEATRAGRALMTAVDGDKLNIASLGNQVSQLHVHVIARHTGDPAWPGPVWGQGPAVPYDPDVLTALVARLAEVLGVSSPAGQADY